MKLSHFAALHPRCPACRSPLSVALATRAWGDDDVLEGILTCARESCGRDYPIVDGIPILLRSPAPWLTANPLTILMRDDLTPELEALLARILDPSTPYHAECQAVSTYASDHYGGLDPAEPSPECAGGAAAGMLNRALDLAGAIAAGPVLDIGCAVGRTTFELARRCETLTVGVDLDFALLRVASSVLRRQRVRYGRRDIGMRYQRREFPAVFPRAELVDFWCCNAADLPFADQTFAAVSCLNVLDSVSAPREALNEIARALASQGKAFISTPYDWSAAVTPVDQWIAGAPRSDQNENAAMHALLEGRFSIIAEERDLRWRVRLHARSALEFSVHLIVAEAAGGPRQ